MSRGHREAAQDIEFLQVVFKDAQTPGLRGKASKKDLFDTLAQFTAAYPDLRRDLELLPKLQEGAGSHLFLRVAGHFGIFCHVHRVFSFNELFNVNAHGLRQFCQGDFSWTGAAVFQSCKS